MTFDAALVATGGAPQRLSIPGSDLPNVFLLRTQADARAIVAAAKTARRVVVIGAGFIAMEVAASLRERSLEITVVAPQLEPFEKQLGAEVGSAIRRLHQRQGVVFMMDQTVEAIIGDGQVSGVRLQSGTVLPADLVVAGLGIKPAAEIIQNISLRKDGGVDVDSRLNVSGSVYAAGDIAAYPLRGHGPQIRVEHWRVAEQHGRVAARNMLGGSETYDAVPYFWTIHFMQRLDYVGHAAEWDNVVIEGDLDKPQFMAFYLRNGSVAAVAGWDRDQLMAKVITLMTARQDWTVQALKHALEPPADS